MHPASGDRQIRELPMLLTGSLIFPGEPLRVPFAVCVLQAYLSRAVALKSEPFVP